MRRGRLGQMWLLLLAGSLLGGICEVVPTNSVEVANSSGLELTLRTASGGTFQYWGEETDAVPIPAQGHVRLLVPEHGCVGEALIAVDDQLRVRERRDELCAGERWMITTSSVDPP